MSISGIKSRSIPRIMIIATRVKKSILRKPIKVSVIIFDLFLLKGSSIKIFYQKKITFVLANIFKLS